MLEQSNEPNPNEERPHRTVYELIVAQAQKKPNAPAILAPGRAELSFRDLAAQLATVVTTLNGAGIGRSDRVAIVLPNGPDMAVAFLAVASGATSAPLNPAYRTRELEFYLQDLGTKLLLTQAGFDTPARAVAAARGIPILELHPGAAAGAFTLSGQQDAAAPDPAWAQAIDVALLLHTSGTTSRPKMVPLTQTNITASAGHIAATLQLTAGDRCLNVMPLFHIHGLMAATLASLSAGGSLVCTPGFVAAAFYDWLQSFQPSWYTAVPTIHQQVLAGAAAHEAIIAQNPLRFIRSSSASLPPQIMADLESRFHAPVIEAYGMTEAAHQMTSNPLPPGRRKAGSVGLPAGPEVAIMAETTPTLLPPGQAGEIVIRGVNVTAGYAENPEAKQAAFADGWFRTGDQGRFDEEGYLFITGRLKEIINRGGEKIAPREVDECLLQHPAVSQAVTFALPHTSLGEDVAAAVILRPDANATEQELRAFTATHLADFKVPARILLVDDIPKGPSGKLQRIGLAEQLADKLQTAYAAPATATEERLARIFGAVLARPPVGRHDNFFILGGDSLSAAQIISDIEQEMAVRLPLTTLLQAPTVAALAAAVAEADDEPGGFESTPLSLDVAGRWQPFPLTDTQQAYWVGRGDLFAGGRVAHHNYVEIEGEGWDPARLQQAWQMLLARHDMLRAMILPDGHQQVLAEVPAYQIPVTDLRHAAPAAIEAHLAAARHELSHQVIPADRWPLFDIRITRLPRARLRLHISLDGLIADAWSRRRLLREWGHIYQQPDHPLPPLRVTFRDYVHRLVAARETNTYERHRAYWQARLADFPNAPALPQWNDALAGADRPEFTRQSHELSPAQWQRLKARGQQAGLSTAALLLTIFADVLAVWSGEHHFALNVARFDRRPWHPQIEDVVGPFGAFTLLEVRFKNEETFLDRARRLQAQLWQDMAHGAFTGVAQLRELSQQRAQIGAATMPVVITMYAPERGQEATGPSLLELGQAVFEANQTPQVWLDLHVFEKGRAGGEDNALQCDWDAVSALFPDGLMRAMFAALQRRLRRLAAAADGWEEVWSDTAQHLVPPAPRPSQARGGADEEPAAPPADLLQSGFLQQATTRPDQTAIITPQRQISYGELHSLVQRWGRRLRQLGARPNRLVAVVMEKGWEQVVAVLSVLQAGAAYLPIDPAVPPERLDHLLKVGEVELLLTQSWLGRRHTWPEVVQQLWLDEDPEPAGGDAPLTPPQAPDDLAAVIYTSGSTGRPNGVMLTHGGLLNAIAYTRQRFAVDEKDVVLALTALHHDMSIFDIFGLLAAGGTIVMPAAEDIREPAAWLSLLRRHRVSIWNSVPAMMEMFLAYAAAHPPAEPLPLRLAFLGGDWISLSLPARLRSAAPRVKIVSVGGPTETSLWNVMFPVAAVDDSWSSIPYGRPIANNRYYILNEAMADCPAWVPGEMYCAGVGVARGYWRDEASSRAKFVTHPRTGERLCRTGDIGRFRPDGVIEFLGRRDFQVKINGQRIELGEIEAALQKHPRVANAVVLATGAPRGKKQLAAFVVAAGEAAGGPDLDAFLRTKLPPHMVPGRFHTLARLPLTGNGKVDRRALAELATTDASESGSTTEALPLITQVGAMIATVLDRKQIDPHANLITLGADSIDMIRIGNQMEEQFGLRLRMDQIFRLTTVAALAQHIAQKRAEALSAPIPISPAAGLYRALLTPEERAAFKQSQINIRSIDEAAPFVPLPLPPLNEGQRQAYATRRSVRHFSLKPIPLAQWGQFLRVLSPIERGTALKYRWASPGGLYPLQIYLHVQPGRIEELSSGIYYYHPLQRRLVQITAQARLSRDIHAAFTNAPIFDEAAFSLFMIAEPAAIQPAYGERWLHLVTLEAGNIAHLLEREAPLWHLGLCQIGAVDFDRIRTLFNLGDDQPLIHSMLGGRVDVELETTTSGRTGQESGAERLLKRIQQLSDEEAQQLLAAQKRHQERKS